MARVMGHVLYAMTNLMCLSIGASLLSLFADDWRLGVGVALIVWFLKSPER